MTNEIRSAAVDKALEAVIAHPFDGWATRDLIGVIGQIMEGMRFEFGSHERTVALMEAQGMLAASAIKAAQREHEEVVGAAQRAIYDITGELIAKELDPARDLRKLWKAAR